MSRERSKTPYCHDCEHYGYHGGRGGRGGGTPPWPVCRFRLRSETCGRYVATKRPFYSWEQGR